MTNNTKDFFKRYGVGMALAAAALATLSVQALRDKRPKKAATTHRRGGLNASERREKRKTKATI